eukprot:Gb_38191 [translate_table: standard]
MGGKKGRNAGNHYLCSGRSPRSFPPIWWAFRQRKGKGCQLRSGKLFPPQIREASSLSDRDCQSRGTLTKEMVHSINGDGCIGEPEIPWIEVRKLALKAKYSHAPY